MPETALFPLHASHSTLPTAHSSHDLLRLQRRRGADLAVGPSAYPINTVQVVPESSSMMSRRHCSGPARAVHKTSVRPRSPGGAHCVAHAQGVVSGLSRSTGRSLRSSTTSSRSSGHPCTSRPSRCSGSTRSHHPSASRWSARRWGPCSTRRNRPSPSR